MSKKSLVLFYSRSGNTRRIAQIIAEKAGADMREIQMEVPYSQDHDPTLSQVKQVPYPALCPAAVDWSAYDVIYLGTPNWWSSMTPPVAAFLREGIPAGKTIAPFCTHAGGGEGHIARDIQSCCTGCDVLPLLAVRKDGGAQAEAQVEQWLKHINP